MLDKSLSLVNPTSIAHCLMIPRASFTMEAIDVAPLHHPPCVLYFMGSSLRGVLDYVGTSVGTIIRGVG